MIEHYKKVDIAKAQLDAAIKLYFIGDEYFSSITLAGAAENVFGSILKLLGKEPALYSFARTERMIVQALHGEEVDENELRKAMNDVRNNIKHFSGLGEQEISLDPKESAEHMINRAISNLEELNLPKSKAIELFEKYYENCEL
ncbi:hypothetical protein NBRC116493_07350 [Aurantivibrio infirmus]